ncbi:D-2-hydroxyglutarate dehydrogenase, mitochondrial isoform X1 [Glossina fuscipes]|uniref:D-2-hydroxyglutarate dehydrogenase, mitochondrial n=1 Tax=Glossina fuscipes TaxID=7396 RepID=A0A9C6DZE3_9MUSC|nr:D-2-hydroxyglutarate dehydrogenase, mitochondrial isoform X1 [Glossina fuscipes]XP_037898095.1 D-2-hydroxyglutarate dehydrogenase, mitochondrial isoform X1 [Glossina fuscipes]
MRFQSMLKFGNGVRNQCRMYMASGLPEFTQKHYNVKRNNYAIVDDKDVNFFGSLMGAQYVLQDAGTDDLLCYNVDFLRSVRGNSKLVLRPGTTQEISEILKYCNKRHLAVCPQGGNTGLVGGAVPVCDEIILSMARLNKVLNIDEITGIASCEAACILENFDAKAREKGLVVPIDLGAKSSCHIGGNLSTNAGGLRVLRYGNLHGSVLGVEVVLANGTILDLMSNFKKDNTGYHLKHLFIGSEGTLGIITKLAILCQTVSSSVHVAFVGLNSFDSVLKTFLNAKRYLGEILSACELIDERSLDASVKQYNLKSPIENYPFHMLIETSGSNAIHDSEKLNFFLEHCMNSGDILNGTVTNEVNKIQEIWKLRELIPTALIRDGFCFKYDISLPLRSFYDIVPVLEGHVGKLAKRVCGYGHLGDSNLHLNVSCEEYSRELYERIEPFIYEHTAKLKGSVSAEHGIGFTKKNYLKYSKSSEAITMMREVKKLLDPSGILNPYKVLN